MKKLIVTIQCSNQSASNKILVVIIIQLHKLINNYQLRLSVTIGLKQPPSNLRTALRKYYNLLVNRCNLELTIN